MGETSTLRGLQRYSVIAKIGITAGILAIAAATPEYAHGVSDACDLVSRVSSLIGVFGTIILIVALAMILYSALLFIVGGANEETLRKARTVLIWSLVGLAVAFLATLADDIVIELLKAGGLQTTCPPIPGL